MPLTTYTAGEVLTAASLNANFTFAAANPTGGLTFIASVTPAGGASITFTNCFSATYNSYLMVGNAWTSAGAGADCYLTISGSTGSTYNWGGFYTNYSATTLNGYKAAATNLGVNMGLASTVTNGFTTWIRNPFAAAETTFSSQFAAAGSTAANGYTMISNGYDSNTSSSASCTISLSGGTTFTGGTIKIYGLANS